MRKDLWWVYEMVNFEKVIMRYKKLWYIKIVDKEEIEGIDIKILLYVYDDFDDCFLICVSFWRVSISLLV